MKKFVFVIMLVIISAILLGVSECDSYRGKHFWIWDKTHPVQQDQK